MCIHYLWRVNFPGEHISLTVTEKSMEFIRFARNILSKGSIDQVIHSCLLAGNNILSSMMKAYFSPLLIIAPWGIILFYRKFKSFTDARGILSFCLLSIVIFIFEIPHMNNGHYFGMFPAIIFSILVLIVSLKEMFLRIEGKMVRSIVILLVPVVLIVALMARGYRDFYRSYSTFGIVKILRSSLPIRSTLYTPYGASLKIKGFNGLAIKNKYQLKRIGYIQKHELVTLLQDEKEVYLFLDDYFINHFYWVGRFFTKIQKEVIEGITVERLEIISPDSPNIGYLFKIYYE